MIREIHTLENYHDENGNRIVYEGSHRTKEVDIFFVGGNNVVSINSHARLEKIFIKCWGRDAKIEIGNCKSRLYFAVGSTSTVVIGDQLTTTGILYVTALDESTIVIGNDCMISGGVQIRGDDAHPIYDIETGRRINKASHITIGDHVWLGEGCVILNKTSIGSGSIIGTRSVVKGKVPNNSVAAGNPARIVKKNVAWERPYLGFDELFNQDGTLKEHVNSQYWHKTVE